MKLGMSQCVVRSTAAKTFSTAAVTGGLNPSANICPDPDSPALAAESTVPCG